MKLFYQKRAGVSFCGGDAVSTRFDKKYVEYVMKIDGGWHGFVNLVRIPDGVMLFTYWGEFFTRLNEIDRLELGPDECTHLQSLMEDSHPDYHVIATRNTDTDDEMVVLGSPMKCDPGRYYVELAGDPAIFKRAHDLLTFSLRLLQQLHKSAPTNPTIASLLRPRQ